MKTKFESNVATQIPKTKMSQEPQLPWDVVRYDTEQDVPPSEDNAKLLTAGRGLFGVRPVFLVLMLMCLFAVTAYVFGRAAEDNQRVRAQVQKKEELAASLQKNISTLKVNLDQSAIEKDVLEERASRLEEDVSNLETQNKTFITVIENLSKKIEFEEETDGRKTKPVKR